MSFLILFNFTAADLPGIGALRPKNVCVNFIHFCEARNLEGILDRWSKNLVLWHLKISEIWIVARRSWFYAVLRLIEMMSLHSLIPYQPANKLQIRVCRMWITKTIEDDPQPQSLDCVFVDKQGDAVHATVNARDIQFFLDLLTVGDAYEITKFRVVHNRTSSKVVPHPAALELNRRTTFVPIHKTNQEIPKQWFNLIDLDQLHKRINNDVELTDVFGHLTAVQPIEDVTVQSSRIAKKRNLNLQDIRGETIRITLWGEAATTFEDSGIKSLPPPIFLAVTSLKVKEYRGNPVLGSTGSTVCIFNPEIPQLTQYKQKFKDLKSPVQTLRTSAEMYADRAVSPNFESKTIDELLLFDPALHKNVSFECKATVIGFDLSRGWWYKSCPFCHKAVKKTSGAFQCNEHGSLNRLPEPWFKINLIVEDSTNQHNFLMLGRNAEKILHVSCHTLVIEDGYDDPFMVPPPLKKLVGETKRFLLSFGNQNSDFRKTDFIIYGLLQDQLPLNTAIASIDPQTPTATAGKQIITEATPAPVTPSQRPDHHPQSVVPLKTSKRPLFIDQADKPDSKKTRTEQIEVTNSARIAREFHKLVVPKIEPADKEPIAALKTKSQTKKTKDSAQDVRPPKK
ncbi:replication protein A 70 kDa DNA-binding subunit B isoform X2 [Malus domestica]|uniref:replication protein A 70 kDa DNA-binding subunit B isoform X2 n=1 Tax=Malus domestica TaxID=3750 RepID=UPI0039750E87